MTTILVEKQLGVRMRDGVALVTDVHRPQTEARLPALVQISRTTRSCPRSPTRAPTCCAWSRPAMLSSSRTLAWAASQPWSNGRRGMIGGSYFGATQWLAATQASQALQPFAPFIAAADYHEGWAYQGHNRERVPHLILPVIDRR
jgi:uncharacterized protein